MNSTRGRGIDAADLPATVNAPLASCLESPLMLCATDKGGTAGQIGDVGGRSRPDHRASHPNITAWVSGAVVDNVRLCPVKGITTA